MTKHYSSWRKSHHSNPDSHCVEVGLADNGTVGVRDSKQHGNGPILELTPTEWATLVRKIQNHELEP